MDLKAFALASEDDCLRRLHDLRDRWGAGSANDFRTVEPPEIAEIDFGREPLVLLGASNEFAQIFIAHAVAHYQVVAICDNYKVGAVVCGVTVESDAVLPELRRAHPRLAAVNLTWGLSGTRYFEGIAARVGIPCIPMMLAYRRATIPSAFALIDRQTERTLAGFDRLLTAAPRYADSLSRETLYRLMLSRITQERRWLNRINVNYHTMYFSHGLFELGHDEHYVDVGAYTGDTIKSFCWHVGNTFRRIDAFEPNPEVVGRLTASVEKLSNVHVHPVGASDRNEDARLHSIDLSVGAGIAAKIEPDGEIAIKLRRIDDEVPAGVTLLKLDVEGHEAAALAGARETLRRDRPNLAISAYHRNDDVLDLALQILELEPSYRLYLRHHADWYWDTVIYAIST